MKEFIKPELKIITFSNEDIIQTSGEITPSPEPTATPVPTSRPGIPGSGGEIEF